MSNLGVVRHRQVALLMERCYVGLDAAALRVEVLHRLRSVMSIDAAFFASIDPVTLLFTTAVSEEPLRGAAARFLDNEFGAPDVNRFVDLSLRPDPIGSLDAATQGDRTASVRYTDIMAPLGLGDELRVVLRSRSHSWGVMCLHRSNADAGFSEPEIAVLRRIAPHVAEGLRRAQVLDQLSRSSMMMDVGIVLLDDELHLASMNAVAEQWLAEMTEEDWPSPFELPVPIYTVAARLLADEVADTRGEPRPTQGRLEVRVRTAAGTWASVRASRIDGPSGRQIAVVIESASAQRLVSVLLAARGLTPAQERVAALVLRGLTTRQIAAQAHISANTVQEHLTAIFEKFGVHSRRALVTAVGTAPGTPT
ncbi:LuxR C-terminal-related transcriptional regulator [Amnibacterium sp.]|uniref:helix-turn-helix transcriptional regulator n=1 Tax=Amnibacterium sp. TaxID=1872496 RepID=UPI00261A813A|nr:LuxR C-terminal-related transcriptional regulator [Amnibacterium sp.]